MAVEGAVDRVAESVPVGLCAIATLCRTPTLASCLLPALCARPQTTEFLWAASQGNEAKVRQMLQQGCPADSADYGERAVFAFLL